MTIPQTVALQGFTHHLILLPTPIETKLVRKLIVNAKKPCFFIKQDTFACKKMSETAIQGKIFRCTDRYSLCPIHEPYLIGNLKG